MGFTDHDRELTVSGVTCRADSGWTAGAVEGAIGAQAGSAAVSGGLDAGSLSEADIVAGLYDGAAVELWRVDWTTPSLKVRLWKGRIARIQRDGDRFNAELEGPAAALERVPASRCASGATPGAGDRRPDFRWPYEAQGLSVGRSMP